jgi:hypothetical protein
MPIDLLGASPGQRATLYPHGAEDDQRDVGLDVASLSVMVTDLGMRNAAGAQLHSDARWLIEIEAETAKEKVYPLGRVITFAPRDTIDRTASRVVAQASCPGARNWRVNARLFAGTRAQARAELELMASPCCLTPGVFAIPGFSERVPAEESIGPLPNEKVLFTNQLLTSPLYVASAEITGMAAFRYWTVFIEYTAGAGGGFPELFWMNKRTPGGSSFLDSQLQGQPPPGGIGAIWTTDLSQLDASGPPNPNRRTLSFVNPGGVDVAELRARELGVPGTPGTISAWLRAF